MNIFTQYIKKTSKNAGTIESEIRRDLIRREAKIGREIFGPIQKGHDREFFRLDKQTWIWQETWVDNGTKKSKTTKYMIRERDIVKSINGDAYQKVSIREAKHLESAIHTYVDRVKKHVYGVAQSV